MKKIYTFLLLLSIGITQIYAQYCLQCDSTIASGNKATSIGTSTVAGGNNSFAGGYFSLAPAKNSFAFGSESKASGLNGIALGNNATVNNFADGIAIGTYVKSDATNSLVFGMGTSSSPLVNSKNNSIMFGVSNLPSLTIAKYGNSDRGYLGIGTNDPQEMAHVVGKLLIDRTVTTASSLQFKHFTPLVGQDDTPLDDPYYWDIFSDCSGLKFNTIANNGMGTQRMIISQEGSVGIGAGVTYPKAKLHVDQNILANGNITTLNKFVLSPDYSSSSAHWEITRINTGLNYAYLTGMLSQDVLFMGNDGSIGIGKTNPSATLDVNGSFKAQGAEITGTLTANALSAPTATIPTLTGNTNVTGTLSANAFEVTKLTISQDLFVNGSLGIGTNKPKEKLQVVDGSILISKTTTSGTDGSLIFDDCKINGVHCGGSYHIWGIQYHHFSGKNGLEFWNDDGIQTKTEEGDKENTRGKTSALFLSNNNNVGIGTTNPQAKLDIDGSFKSANADITGSLMAGSATINGALTANTAEITGAANVTGALTANSATINGAANVTGALTANSAKITGLIEAPSAAIKGKIKAQEIEVTSNVRDWPDYVFENDYPLMNLQEVEQYIKENKHLPAVPSAAEVEVNGVNLGEMNAILIQKVEELTLYILDLQKQINELKETKGGQ